MQRRPLGRSGIEIAPLMFGGNVFGWSVDEKTSFALLDAQRHQEALQQLQLVTRERPDFPETWLAEGTLLVQDNQLAEAEASLQKYMQLAQAQPHIA